MTDRYGRLHVIAGCMSSGKTGELIRLLSRHEVTGDSIVIFKHTVDSRDGDKARSRLGTEMEARVVSSPGQIDAGTCRVVAIEEAQFFGDGLVPVIRRLLASGHLVYVTGLNQDFRGEPFGIMPVIMSLADEISMLTAICQRCHGVATRTQRIIDSAPAPWDSPLILVGGADYYEARCPDCHEVPGRP
ncbi:MAG: thymidine kinase [Actinobacteria bacterium HGW-Actinobacteria-10]|jgi:thymidine kinase|nr:MAG: thymidine kinase [Actinobacteria bacterium HGW-Actinobacteria-10]